ncbi:MAG TPA: hypothetical protein VHR45_13165 [Thermoanaerobaculia bacterium]|nr:hypothetical protein [Thermoanaerobaculia bacterium]
MWTPSDRLLRSFSRAPMALIPAVMAVSALALAPPSPAQAVGAGANPPVHSAAGAATGSTSSLSNTQRRELRQAIAKRYRVRPIHNGVVLEPYSEKFAVSSIEMTGDRLAINGSPVNAEVARAWLREEAEPVLRLLALAPADRQALFDLRRDVSPAAPATPAAGASAALPPAPPAPPAENRLPGAPGGPSGASAPAGDSGAAAEEAERAKQERTAADEQAAAAKVEAEAAKQEAESAKVDAELAKHEAGGRGAKARSVSSGSRMHLGGSVTVEPSEVAESVVTIGGNVRVEGEVAQDVTAVGGSVRINGKVGGDVTAVAGNVHLGPHSEVMGDVVSVGGTVIRDPGAHYHGNVNDVSLLPQWVWRDGGSEPGANWPMVFVPFGLSWPLLWTLTKIVLLVLIGWMIVVLGRASLEKVAARVADEEVKAAATGFLSQILFLPLLAVVTVLLVISIVGCALLLLYPFVFLAIVVAGLVGFTAVALQVGRVLAARFNRPSASPYAAVLAGILAIEASTLIGRMLAAGGGPFHFISWPFLIIGLVVRYAAWTVGLGAVILTAFEHRPRRWRRLASPPPGGEAFRTESGAARPAWPAGAPAVPTTTSVPESPSAPSPVAPAPPPSGEPPERHE